MATRLSDYLQQPGLVCVLLLPHHLRGFNFFENHLPEAFPQPGSLTCYGLMKWCVFCEYYCGLCVTCPRCKDVAFRDALWERKLNYNTLEQSRSWESLCRLDRPGADLTSESPMISLSYMCMYRLVCVYLFPPSPLSPFNLVHFLPIACSLHKFKD